MLTLRLYSYNVQKTCIFIIIICFDTECSRTEVSNLFYRWAKLALGSRCGGPDLKMSGLKLTNIVMCCI
jgi:hypothetical protein